MTYGGTLFAAYWAQRQDSGYVKDGLVCWLDGIDNTRHGHDANAQKWEDLSGNGYEFEFVSKNPLQWTLDSLVFPGGSNNYIDTGTLFGELQDYTFEVVFERTSSANYNSCFSSLESGGAGWQYANGSEYALIGRPSGGYYSFDRTLDSSVSRHSKSLTASIGTGLVVQYMNGLTGDVQFTQYVGTRYNSSWNFCIGTDAKDNNSMVGHFCALRVYNRALTQAEIQHNYAIDKARFNLA